MQTRTAVTRSNSGGNSKTKITFIVQTARKLSIDTNIAISVLKFLPCKKKTGLPVIPATSGSISNARRPKVVA